MNRRKAIQLMTFVGGGTLIGLEMFMKGCKPSKQSIEINFDEVAILDQVGEIIIPRTNTPGAKAAEIGLFMKTIVTDCYTEEEQNIFKKGITSIQEISNNEYKKTFLFLSQDEQLGLLEKLDQEAKLAKKQTTANEKQPEHFFTMMKQLTIWGFFTSKIGQTEVYDYRPVPGKFEACIPYKKGDKVMN